jgi:non-lysosomal glucosylceramidase
MAAAPRLSLPALVSLAAIASFAVSSEACSRHGSLSAAGSGGATAAGPSTSSTAASSSSGTAGGPSDAGPEAGPAQHQPGEPIAIPSVAWSHDVAKDAYVDGAPIGGLGAGSVTWRFDGAFYHDRLDIGASTQTIDPDAAFFMYQKAGANAATTMRLDQTLGAGQAKYYALFPRAWVDYSGSAFPCKVKVEQYSPLIPGDGQRSSYPLGIYRWQIDNPTNAPCDVAVMLTWKNDHGGTLATAQTTGNQVGLVLGRSGGNATSATQGELTLASLASSGVTVSYQSATSAAVLESQFAMNGALAGTTGSHANGGVAFKTTVQPGQRTIVPIVLAWDIPITQQGTGPGWYREYTRHFGRSGQSSWAIAQEALGSYEPWLWAIEDWQASIVGDPKLPAWLVAPLFNELYDYVIAGTTWEAGAASGQADDPNEDMFSSLESYVYPFYGTSDVRFYGSWALAQLWPDLDKQEVKQFCDSVATMRADRPPPLGTTAHDFGSGGSLFQKWNAYTYRDTTTWKDLNSKLILMVYRDWVLTGKSDGAFLSYCWPAVQAAMAKVKSQDTDNDGLPNSNGIDQTYDNMNLKGNTAYCGGLFLAACEAAEEIATAMGNAALATQYKAWFTQGQASFEAELWTGTYYRIDTASQDTTRIMSDQLNGEWYARSLGLPPIVDPARAASALSTVHDKNFKLFVGGTRGVVNVMTAAGAIDTTSSQTQECWVGTSWGVVAAMIQEGLAPQAAEIGQSLTNTIWTTDALWWRTPEAWLDNGQIRAPYYMRANTLWAAKRAYDLLP